MIVKRLYCGYGIALIMKYDGGGIEDENEEVKKTIFEYYECYW